MPAALALELFHGREMPDTPMQNWGAQGPVFLVSWVHVTYCWDIRIGLDVPEGEGMLETVNDLVYYDGAYYGDWAIHDRAELERAEGLAARLETYDATKAFVPEARHERRSS
jgi:hypothetical protein